MRWCPAPNCTNAIKVSHVESRPVTCRCGHRFCFACSENWHDPVRCHLIKKWIKKCDDDSETSNWISANTKECPTCNATIEKDGGCNHMICKNQACKADFCWVCLGMYIYISLSFLPKKTLILDFEACNPRLKITLFCRINFCEAISRTFWQLLWFFFS